MNRPYFRTFIRMLLLICILPPLLLTAQNYPEDRIVATFSNPDEPGKIELHLLHGGIDVKGYDGKEVIITARVQKRREPQEISDPKARGLRRVPLTTTGLEVEEHRNRMEINLSSVHQSIDVTLQVPRNTSLELGVVNNGDITVREISGELDINNTNGAVTLTHISGAVVAHALNRDLTVVFDKITPGTPMSLSTLNGDVDVTFPASVKASLKLKSQQGSIYSDFDIIFNDTPPTARLEKSEKKRGRMRIERTQFGQINGGGPEFQLSTFNGNIYIRKEK